MNHFTKAVSFKLYAPVSICSRIIIKEENKNTDCTITFGEECTCITVSRQFAFTVIGSSLINNT